MTNGSAVRTGLTAATFTRTVQQSQDYPYYRSLCVDEVNKRTTDNPLTINFEGRQIRNLNGFINNLNGTTWTATDYFPPGLLIAPGHQLTSNLIPSIGEVALGTIASSNPSKPSISIPNFVYEIKDLPEMIRDIGRLKLLPKRIRHIRFQQLGGKASKKEVANHFLSYQMGWAPLIEDLQKILGFQALVDKKMRELQNLYHNGGLQRRVRKSQWKASVEQVPSNIYLDSAFISLSLSVTQTRTTRVERWGTVRWTPSKLPDPRFSSKDLARLARDLTFGMKGISGKQAWDAIPWTWLIGWFTNFGDFLQANQNSIPLVHSAPCVMTKTETTYRWVRTDGLQASFTGGDGAMFFSTKSRTISSGSVTAHLPFLGAKHFAILAALAIQRKR